jgi:hypothetical protein
MWKVYCINSEDDKKNKKSGKSLNYQTHQINQKQLK